MQTVNQDESTEVQRLNVQALLAKRVNNPDSMLGKR